MGKVQSSLKKATIQHIIKVKRITSTGHAKYLRSSCTKDLHKNVIMFMELFRFAVSY